MAALRPSSLGSCEWEGASVGRAMDLLPGGDHLAVLDFLHNGAHLTAGHCGCRQQSGGCGAPQARAPPPVSHTEGSSDSPTPSGRDEADSYLPGWAVRPGMRSTGWPGCRKRGRDLST